jgi:PTH2 family peptidyl-tRNA hydrolase
MENTPTASSTLALPKIKKMAELDRVPPSTTAYVIATAILAGITGYFIGQGASLGLFSSAKEKEGWPNSYNVKVPQHSSDEEDEEDEDYEDDSEEEGDGGELANFDDSNEEVKLVLVVRTDLGMTKGKSFPCASPPTLGFSRSSP